MSRLLTAFLIALVLSTPADAYSRKRWSGAIILWNYTDVPIPYQVCSDGESPCFPERPACKSDPCGKREPAPCKPCAPACVVREPDHLCEGVLEPGGWEYHGRTRDAKWSPLHFQPEHRRDLHFSVRFDGSFAPGVQHAIVHLPHNTVEADTTKPIQARAYAFIRVGREIHLVKGDHPAVAAIGRPQFAKWAREWAPPPPPSYREWLWKPTGTVAGAPGSVDPALGRPTMPRAGYSGYPGAGAQVPGVTLSDDPAMRGAGPSTPSGAYLGGGRYGDTSISRPVTTQPAGAGPSTIGRPTGNPGYQPMSGAAAGVTPGTSSPSGTSPAIPSTTPTNP